MSNVSIAERYRREGYEQGYYQGAQSASLKDDELRQEGFADAWTQRPSRLAWFAVGFTIGFLPCMILLAKVLP